jgi:hypothetical protein
MDSALYTLANGNTILKVRGRHSSRLHPIHLISLIDVSGSMAEEGRLENVKRSLHFMYPYMSQHDLVSLITFDSSAELHLKAEPMTLDGIHHAQQILNSLVPKDMTNLAAALAVASDLVTSTPATHKAGMIILTDGVVNQGIKDTTSLKSIVRDLRNATPHLTVFTTGYGSEHNHELLAGIAGEGNGSYTVVNSQEQVASVFGDILGGLMSCVAQNAELIAPAGTEVNTHLKVHVDPDQVRVQIGDIYSQGEQTVLLGPVAAVKVRYFDLDAGAMKTETVAATQADAAIEAEAAANELRLRVAAFLRAPLREAADPLIAEVRAMPTSWSEFIIDQLIAIRDARHVDAAITAQQSCCLSLARGMMAPPPPIAMPGYHPMLEATMSAAFSSPSQRQVSSAIRVTSQFADEDPHTDA